jgi:hypothetical protein
MSTINRHAIAAAALATILWPQAGAAQSQKRESAAEMRRIVAQSICLAEAYPDSPIASDSAGVVAVYQGSFGGSVSARDVEAVRGLARDAKPAAPTPVGDRNLAIARCVLFADRADVTKLLGGKAGGKK